MNSAIPYNKLTQLNKQEIINLYYTEKELSFKDISIRANVSERAVSRVLKEENINTRLKNKYTIKNVIRQYSIIEMLDKLRIYTKYLQEV